MSEKPGIADRVGAAINELDVDFGRFTLVGWVVSLLSLALGGSAASFLCMAMVRRNGWDLAAGMAFCLAMIAVTTGAYLALRWAFEIAGLGLVDSNSTSIPGDSNSANRDTLNRMANTGMDMNAAQGIEFLHLFETRQDAEKMGRWARQESFEVVSIEPNEDSGGYDVQICVELVPALDAINKMEMKLAAIATQCNGQADGWGVRDGG